MFCESEFSSENINFYLEVQEFQKLNLTEEESQVRLQKLYDDYISDKSENQVSVSFGVRDFFKFILARAPVAKTKTNIF